MCSYVVRYVVVVCSTHRGILVYVGVVYAVMYCVVLLCSVVVCGLLYVVVCMCVVL